MPSPLVSGPALLLTLGLLAPAARAQTAAPADTARAYKHQFGLTASPQLAHFFTANRSLPLGLLYQRQTAPHRAWRLRLVGAYRSLDSTNFVGALPGTGTRVWQVLTFAGCAWQRRLGPRFELYYGAELGGGLGRDVRRSVRDYFNDQGPFNEDVSYTVSTWQAQARPFAGVRARLSARASAFFETAAPLTYVWKREGYSGYLNQKYFITPSGTTQLTYSSDYESAKMSIDMHPIEFIGFSYSF